MIEEIKTGLDCMRTVSYAIAIAARDAHRAIQGAHESPAAAEVFAEIMKVEVEKIRGVMDDLGKVWAIVSKHYDQTVTTQNKAR